ncbi:hypothetical protein GCM10022254_05250 [Actinomadura meridiana]|uniref:Uncharacterized protein n=1 Tax=Actinomadura meridiana TaxID=559626 RepID=A0ABP8BSK8_9ACTN
MAALTEVHPAEETRTPSGLTARIDELMVPVVRRLWAAGYTTLMCCQDVGDAMANGGMWPVAERWHAFLDSYAWLKLPLTDAHNLMKALDGTQEFNPRLTAKAEDGWSSHVWLGPEGMADYSNVYFPASQIPELIGVLDDHAPA